MSISVTYGYPGNPYPVLLEYGTRIYLSEGAFPAVITCHVDGDTLDKLLACMSDGAGHYGTFKVEGNPDSFTWDNVYLCDYTLVDGATGAIETGGKIYKLTLMDERSAWMVEHLDSDWVVNFISPNRISDGPEGVLYNAIGSTLGELIDGLRTAFPSFNIPDTAITQLAPVNLCMVGMNVLEAWQLILDLSFGTAGEGQTILWNPKTGSAEITARYLTAIDTDDFLEGEAGERYLRDYLQDMSQTTYLEDVRIPATVRTLVPVVEPYMIVKASEDAQESVHGVVADPGGPLATDDRRWIYFDNSVTIVDNTGAGTARVFCTDAVAYYYTDFASSPGVYLKSCPADIDEIEDVCSYRANQYVYQLAHPSLMAKLAGIHDLDLNANRRAILWEIDDEGATTTYATKPSLIIPGFAKIPQRTLLSGDNFFSAEYDKVSQRIGMIRRTALDNVYSAVITSVGGTPSNYTYRVKMIAAPYDDTHFPDRLLSPINSLADWDITATVTPASVGDPCLVVVHDINDIDLIQLTEKIATTTGDSPIKWAIATADWVNVEPGTEHNACYVPCNPCDDRKGTNPDTGTNFNVYLPRTGDQDPNVRGPSPGPADVIGYIINGEGDRICVTDYLDDKIGTIKMWNVGDDDGPTGIPRGWEELTYLRGRFPAGHFQGDDDFGTKGGTGGDKSHSHSIITVLPTAIQAAQEYEDEIGTDTQKHLPPFYTLFFIIRVN